MVIAYGCRKPTQGIASRIKRGKPCNFQLTRQRWGFAAGESAPESCRRHRVARMSMAAKRCAAQRMRSTGRWEAQP
ncbi:hypothetical protein AS156_35100 [Bradyrhizobium macuxiense]|uniref:Uncharacterized protein n=1 Tax=Bradyrhizobium macuxiense TaxID=1755647 RepID=A0A109JZK8_9BRAD|nr:hypothetical protein AS156_35100 [Bradyrhizobium macuxiense]